MRRAIGFSLLMLSACVAPSRPAPKPAPPPPAPAPAPTPSLVPQGDEWRDWPLTPGDWVYRRSGASTEAVYGQPDMTPLLVLRCDRAAQRVRILWATSADGPLTIRTTDKDTPRAAGRSAAGGLEADLAARDPLLDQMAFSRGRFMLLAGGQAAIVPAWPEVSRVIEDCR
jgi:hypothetical protein